MKHLAFILALFFWASCSDGLPEQCEEKTPYLDVGKKNGPEWQCHPNGNWKKAVSWRHGIRDGQMNEWYETGVKASDGIFVQGKGKVTRYGEDGKKRLEEHFVNGRREGLKTVWHKNGKKLSESLFQKGKLHGMSFEWYPQGEKKGETKYQQGRLIDNAIIYYKDGNVWKITAHAKGRWVTTTEYWSGQSGPSKSEDFYLNGELYRVLRRDFFGRKVETKEYVLPYGDLSTAQRTNTEYWDNGEKMSEKTFYRAKAKDSSSHEGRVSNMLIGDQKIFFEDGKIAEIEKWRHGKKLSEKNYYQRNEISSSLELRQRIKALRDKRNNDIEKWRKEHPYLFGDATSQ